MTEELRRFMVEVVNQVPSGQQTIGVFGGAFDPPHLGHVMLPAFLRARSWADLVIVAPCADHPLGKTMTGFDQRLAWVRLAMRQHGDFVEVTDLERRLAQTHEGPSFSLRLLEAVQQAHPAATVRLIIGSDITASGEVARWHKWAEIEARFAPLVIPRAGHAAPGDCALPEVSSTRVRHAIAQRDWDDVGRLVPASVAALLRAPAQPRVLIIGTGNVATHAAPWLRERGFVVDVVASRPLPEEPPPTTPDGVWVLVPDPHLEAVAERVAAWALPKRIPILHGAGARLAHEVLRPVSERGHPVGVLHPICALRREHPWPSMLGRAAFGVAGDPAADHFARDLVGQQPILDLAGLDRAGRTRYHAACALLANHLAVLLAAATQVLAEQGHPAEAIRHATQILIRSALENLLALGVPDGVTGPAARGDDDAVAAHVAALAGDTGALYAELSKRLKALLHPKPTR